MVDRRNLCSIIIMLFLVHFYIFRAVMTAVSLIPVYKERNGQFEIYRHCT